MNKKFIERKIKSALKPLRCRFRVYFIGDFVRVYPASGVFTSTELSFLSGIKGLYFVCVGTDSTDIYALFKIEEPICLL